MFTIGKSYLSENHQSYFFIRNDPIRKLIAGTHQSAVICGKFAYSQYNCYAMNDILFFHPKKNHRPTKNRTTNRHCSMIESKSLSSIQRCTIYRYFDSLNALPGIVLVYNIHHSSFQKQSLLLCDDDHQIMVHAAYTLEPLWFGLLRLEVLPSSKQIYLCSS